MRARRIDHTAIAVRDMDEAIARYVRLLGAAPAGRGMVSDQRVEVCFLRLGDTLLELIRPTDQASGVSRFLERRGEALHHVAVLVNDIREELLTLESQGVEVIDREPRTSIHGLVAFVHPRGTGGVLLELVQSDE